ncbi:TPA: TraI domain-containing protein [Pasteurella multocida]|uniref:MobH family relaxase n=1 Tax=Pasteurella multocida TaxID=747 RepID=UPI0010935C6D|nr:MobH family relaxase [Pasteurella multocida]QCA32176.1 relaxase [Pasteurella multocida]QXG51750.1 TraI domain-containing protein [Pasteurella multocida]WGE13631.1 helicase/relaxase domain-containing protein [Pasteurella multocida]HDX0990400.1 TraI domain-containing protein [Pasteurella multocida]HDX0990728.1 TraI domain-containing protein [Pasteurella multocida]
MLKLFNKFLKKELSQAKPELGNVHLIQDNEGWMYPQNANELLNTDLRKKYLGLIWQQVSMDRKMFNTLYRKPIENYAEIVQLLPASESHHHSHIGGMLDHGLEVIAFSAKLRQSYVLPPNVAPEEQSKQRDAWTAAAIYIALVHDIGKVITDVEIILKDGTRWFAWNGIPSQPYKFKYIKGRDYELHPVLGGFLANQLIPKSAFDWIAQFPEVLSSLMYAMAGHYDKAGLLSEIIQKADQHSVTVALGGDVNKLVQRPVNSLAKQLVMALRYLLEHKIKLNTPKGPADGWFTEDGLWLMSKTTADSIRAYLLGQGISVPKDNGKLFDEMQSLGIVEATTEGTAIWHCRIQADSGWTPPSSFTLLKIKPEVAWENVSVRPQYFAGKVKVETNSQENENLVVSEVALPEAQQVSLPVQEVKPIEDESIKIKIVEENHSPIESENDLTEQLLNMFDVNINTEPAKNNISAEPVIKNVEEDVNSFTEPVNIVEAALNVSQSINSQQTKSISTSSEKLHLGKQFVDWLKTGITQNKFAISKNTAKLHIVEDALFIVSPTIFEHFLQEMGMPYDKESITNLQYKFQDLGLHTPRNVVIKGKADTVNFWRCAVAGPRKTSYLIGYLIKDTRLFFGDKVPLNNLCLTLQKEE